MHTLLSFCSTVGLPTPTSASSNTLTSTGTSNPNNEIFSIKLTTPPTFPPLHTKPPHVSLLHHTAHPALTHVVGGHVSERGNIIQILNQGRGSSPAPSTLQTSLVSLRRDSKPLILSLAITTNRHASFTKRGASTRIKQLSLPI